MLEMSWKFYTYVAQKLNKIFSKIDLLVIIKPIASVETPLLDTEMANGVAPIQVKSVILMEKIGMEVPIMSLVNWEHP